MKMPELSGPTMSLGPNKQGRPVPETRSEANEMLEQTQKLKGKADMSEEKVKDHSRLLLDEVLEGSEQVI
jgi:hypothetical protein